MSDALSADRMVASEDHWIPLSDLMTGLMVMFLLIAVCYMVRVEADADKIKTVAVAYTDTRDALYEALRREFSADLPRWHAQLLKDDLTIRFSEPDILFAEGHGAQATYRFKHALIQDAAYDSLLKSRRQALHAQAAEILRDTAVPRCGCAGSGCSGGGLHTVASWTSAGRVSAIVHTTALATSSTTSRAMAGRALRRRNGRPCLSNAVPSAICETTYAL